VKLSFAIKAQITSSYRLGETDFVLRVEQCDEFINICLFQR